MPSSSLIFVLVVAIWAAYLLQHWIRRRDHLSTARSVDRFSEAMRVLERRKPLPESPLAAPEPRSYAVSPARPSRAAVTVKRAAAPSSATSSSAPATARTAHTATAAEAPKVRVRGRFARLLSGLTRRRLRGTAFVVSLLLVVASVVLVPVMGLTWWAVAATGTLLVLDLIWLRHAAAVRGRRARREHAARTASRVRERRVTEAAARRLHQPSRAAAEVHRPAPAGVAADVAATSADRHVDTVYDPDAPVVEIDSPLQTTDPSESPEPQGRPGDWQPVPVPPPTYTLKAKAERPASAPAEVTPAPELFDRTAADQASMSGASTSEATNDTEGMATGADGEAGHQGGEAPYGRDLPFDGLALDEELEELPAVYAAG